jgi:general stress protein 26
MNGATPKFNELIEYLHGHFIAVASTLSPAGMPQSATVFYWANDVTPFGFNIYFVTHRSARKFQNLLMHDAVAVVIGTDFDPNSVQIEGTAEIVEVAEKREDLDEFVKRMNAQPNMARLYDGAFFPRNAFAQIDGHDFAVVRVMPTWVRWMQYDAKEKKLVYHQIIG